MDLLSERRLARLERAVSTGRIIPYLALTTFLVALAAALVVRVFARGEFTTFGGSLWWAAQTITTVGYGDVVPETAFSKTVAVVVMFFGIAIVAIVTAVATSAVVTRSQRRLAASIDAHPDSHLAALARIEARLEALERRLP